METKYDAKLIPTLREGVDIIKMILFRKLKTHISTEHPERDATFVNRLTGAIINDLFGTPNPEEPFASFYRENQALIRRELEGLSENFEEMRIPLTDALRIQFLCDYQEGVDSSFILEQAKELGILIVDRDVPLPAKFMNLVRTLGGRFDILSFTQTPMS